MKVLIVLLGFSVTFVHGLKPGIRVKYGMGSGFGKSYCFKVATTIGDAVLDGWKETCRPPGPFPQLTMYCPEDKVVCALFDKTGYIAGTQVALKDTFKNNPFDPAIQGFTKWNTTIDGECTCMWTIQQYFVSKETLNSYYLKPRNSNRILQEGGVWLTGVHGELFKVPIKEEDIRQTILTKQGCFPGMGLHYFYNLTTTTECTAEQLYPWFILTYQGELIGTVMSVVGEMTLEQGERDWFEHTNRRIAQIIAPRRPECQLDLVDKYGILTMHIYYIDDPRNFTC